MKKIRPLELDFLARRPSAPWAGPLLLALASAFALDLAFTWVHAHDVVRDREARIAALGRPASGSRLHDRPVSGEELAAAEETVRRISLSWDRLFAALETASNEKVALLGVEPDPKTQTVLLSCEGKDYAAALAYVAELRRAGALSRVHLVHHEVKRDDPHRAVAFSVAASWNERPK